MATVDMRPGNKAPGLLTKGSASTYGAPVRVIKKLVDLQNAATQKGSVLAASDFIRVIPIATGSAVLRAGAITLEKGAKSTGSFTTSPNLLKYGVGTTINTAKYVAQNKGDMNLLTYFLPTTAKATYTINTPNITAATLSVGILIGTYAGTALTAGVIGLWAVVADLGEFGQFNIDKTDQAGVPQA